MKNTPLGITSPPGAEKISVSEKKRGSFLPVCNEEEGVVWEKGCENKKEDTEQYHTLFGLTTVVPLGLEPRTP